MVPCDILPEIVPVPVTAKLNVAGCPSQIVVVPLNTAVGLGFTVTTALPLKSPGCAAQIRTAHVCTPVTQLLVMLSSAWIVSAVPLKAMAPGERVPVIVPVAVTAKLHVAGC